MLEWGRAMRTNWFDIECCQFCLPRKVYIEFFLRQKESFSKCKRGHPIFIPSREKVALEEK